MTAFSLSSARRRRGRPSRPGTVISSRSIDMGSIWYFRASFLSHQRERLGVEHGLFGSNCWRPVDSDEEFDEDGSEDEAQIDKDLAEHSSGLSSFHGARHSSWSIEIDAPARRGGRRCGTSFLSRKHRPLGASVGDMSILATAVCPDTGTFASGIFCIELSAIISP